MEFTDLYSNSDLIAQFSPNGKYLVRFALNLKITNINLNYPAIYVNAYIKISVLDFTLWF